MIKKIKQNKTLLSLAALIITLLLIIVVRITYAFLKAKIGEEAQANIHLDVEKLYAIEFVPGSDLNLSVNSKTLTENGGDLEKVSHPRVELRDTNVEQLYSYYVYLDISGSDFIYTNGEENPEIILSVTGPDGDINSIKGLSYNSELGGFDITKTKGLIPIVKQKEMKSNGSELTVQEWTFTLKYRNFDVDQSENLNKSLNIKIIMQQEVIPTNLADVCSAEEKTGECVKKLETTSDYKLTNIVYHNTTDATEKEIPNASKVAGDDSYRFSGSNYKITNKYLNKYNKVSNLIILYCSEYNDFGACIGDLGYTLEYDNDKVLYKTYGEATSRAFKDGYIENVVNNYVCFGGDCSNDQEDPNYKNLYRIIGFFKNDSGQYEMKIIKADYATEKDLGEGTYPDSAYWSSDVEFNLNYRGNLTRYSGYAWNDTKGKMMDSDNINMWAASNLNIKNLNGTYYNSLNATYKNMVVEHEWQVGGYLSDNNDAKEIYDYELGDNKLNGESINCYSQEKPTTVRKCNEPNDLIYSGNNAHVGLMYVSDYMYGTLPDYWTTTADNYDGENVGANNWLYLGEEEWTISRYSDDSYYARYVDSTGSANNNNVVYSYGGVRPVLYLSSDVKIIGGSGTETDPFKLGMEENKGVD